MWRVSDCLKKKFLFVEKQTKTVDYRLVVHSQEVLTIPLGEETPVVTKQILEEALAELDDPVKKFVAHAEIRVNEIIRRDETSCVVSLSIAPRFFEYLELLRAQDIRQKRFMHVFTTRLLETFAEMVKKAPVAPVKEETVDLTKEILRKSSKIMAEVEYQLYSPHSAGEAPSTFRDIKGGYLLHEDGSPEQSHREVLLDKSIDLSAREDLGDTYELHTEDGDLSVLGDVSPSRYELQPDSVRSTESFEESLMRLCQRHNVDIRDVARGIVSARENDAEIENVTDPPSQSVLQVLLNVQLE